MESLQESYLVLSELPKDAREATNHLLRFLLDKIHPLIHVIRNYLAINNTEGEMTRIKDVFTLCSSQINKCAVNLLDIFKLESQWRTILQESRVYTVERLSWCINRLLRIESYLKKSPQLTDDNESANDSFTVIPMYFVNWIDHTFQVLDKLSENVYQNGYKGSEVLQDQWKSEMVNCVTELHVSVDELLLSAMTLCRYCLTDDQLVVKARCKVVLRETKALLSELVQGDPDSTIKATTETLKLPIMPSNVNVLIDVLKDVLYSLETNTNTALLSLVAHCFSYSKPSIDVLKEHFSNNKNGKCSCLVKTEDDVMDNCLYIKDFDLYNERLIQIGNFAVSCSSDQSRILSLRSGLASLESLDPHLVPSLMMSLDSHHAQLLTRSWINEVQDIRDNIYLIVDPTAFAEKSKEMMHQKLAVILKQNSYNNSDVCAVINIGCMVQDFFIVYDRCEPDALVHHDKLLELMSDLDKVQKECKVVSNLLCTNDDFLYEIHMPSKNKEASVDQLVKRLKLLYTLINKIHNLIRPVDNDDQLLEGEDVQYECKNVTHTIRKNLETYINSPRKINNSPSMFARSNVRSSTKHIPLLKLTKRFQNKLNPELSFSVQLDDLFNERTEKVESLDKPAEFTRDSSILYKFSPITKRPSLRKAILNRQSKIPVTMDQQTDFDKTYDKHSVIDTTVSLQITDILDQMNDMTSLLSTPKRSRNEIQQFRGDRNTKNMSKEGNVLTIDVNNQNATISKHIWNIPVNCSIIETPLEESALNVTLPSNVNTLERIHDLNYVESKLNSLKSQLETTL